MQRGVLLPIIISVFLSFSFNYISHYDLFISLINSLTLGSSIMLFRNYLALKNNIFNSFLYISLGLIPIFTYSPNPNFFSLLPLVTLMLIYFYIKFSKNLLVILIFYLFFGNLYLGEVIKYPFDLQNTQLIFNSPEINYNIKRHQQDALFIPYKLRQVFYSQTVYAYALLTNFFDFLNLKNLSDILLLANLYPLFTGIYTSFKVRNLRFILLIALLATMLAAGIDRSPDKYQSLYLLGPIFIYLILLGVRNVNTKIYLALWTISFYIFISPKI